MRWSTKQPTPNFGDEFMPLANVKKFYKFWNDFQTWREFSQYDEYDTAEAQDRYERRYMENENKKKRKKYVKAESARILRLVENAYNNDPRIQKVLKEAEAAKQLLKDEARQRKIDATKAKTDIIEQKKLEKEAAEKAQLEESKSAAVTKKAFDLAYKKAWKDLLVICQETLGGTKFDRFWAEGKQRMLFQTKEKCDECAAQLHELKAREDLDKSGKVELFGLWVSCLGLSEAEKVAAKQALEEAKAKEVTVEDKNWSKEDIANLTKAMVKYPPGTSGRWKVIAEFCGVRNQKEVIKKA